MLVDMLMQACLTDVRDSLMQQLVGPGSVKLPLWYKVHGSILRYTNTIIYRTY